MENTASLLPFESCSSTWICGQTGSGKTRFVFRFLQNLKHMYTQEPPVEVLYCYGIYQELFMRMEKDIPHLTCQLGLPSKEQLDEFTRDGRHRLIIIDDLMHEVIQDQSMELLFTRGCHHRKISAIFVTQNLFPKGKHARTIALNTWYIILMKDPRASLQVSILGRQLFAGKTKGFMQAYEDSMATNGYLVLDSCPRANDRYRIRTQIFPGEEPIIYTLK